MKPREFDELVRQKFDQGDFEYNPRNWERLADELDGKSKKQQRMLAWWWMPAIGVAASIALAVGVLKLWHTNPSAETASVTHSAAIEKSQVITQSSTAQQSPSQHTASTAGSRKAHSASKKSLKNYKSKDAGNAADDYFAIDYNNAVPKNGNTQGDAKEFDFMRDYNAASTRSTAKEKEKKKDIAANTPMQTFKPEEEARKERTLSVILSGGLNRGTQANGYAAGATIRKMVNQNVYVESDVAFASSSATVTQGYLIGTQTITMPAGKGDGSARVSPSNDQSKPTTIEVTRDIVGQQTINYTLNYVQVTPSVGCKVTKRVSLGAGPDFQSALADTRPAASTVDREQAKIAPLFDLGMMGKTEYAITQNVKAAVSYRKGINNLLSPTDAKYIDRDYLQLQVKCAIFNK